MENNRLFGKLSDEKKEIILNLIELWVIRDELQIGQLLDNVTCLDESEILHDVTDEEFSERLTLQLEAMKAIRKNKSD